MLLKPTRQLPGLIRLLARHQPDVRRLVAFEKKLHQMIAESANTVVKHDWVGLDLGQNLRGKVPPASRFVVM